MTLLMENTMVTNVSHNPQDLTGRKKAELAAKHAAEQREKAKNTALVSAQAEELKTESVDLSGPDTVSVATVVEGEVKSVEVKVKKKDLRVNTKLENVTIGHGTNYDFEPGQMYTVTADVYEYLDELGFVWH